MFLHQMKNNMTVSNKDIKKEKEISILAFSDQATVAYRTFSREDFLHMMSEMTLGEIKLDLERFKKLEEYEICKKLEFVIGQKIMAESLRIYSSAGDVNI